MDLNHRPQRKKTIPLRLQDPMENATKSKKPEPKKKIDQKSKSDQKAMSVHEGKMFQCSICKEKFNSKISLESHCGKEHDRSKLKRKKQIPARFCEELVKGENLVKIHESTMYLRIYFFNI